MGSTGTGSASAMAAVLIALSGCGAQATGGQASSNTMQASSQQPVDAGGVKPKPAQASSVSAEQGVIECPATLVSGMTLPSGARLLGAPLGARLSLTSATVTADAVGTMPADLDGIAEVEPVERPGTTGMTVQMQDAAPTADAPFTLICRYGEAKPPLLAQSVALIPLPANGARYDCTTRLPQGKDPRTASAMCKRS
ncbi:hypothetical protein E5673_14090 [Sphingomonas sp. PAMC26645]|uniref:hypothetical protein n=1 Tax=Sphingomonas sp. PAMC26645 TaxID=2565555 RepID=UPI00109DC983|nr:hypothetical protein [Sphingomonas sp. PAMC26645]QCB43210.1 hypothetical protein E5673_14090 [Sphingomonas sp. PAMC26645]